MMTPVYTAIFGEGRLNDEQNTADANFFAFMGKPVRSATWVVGQGQHVFATDVMNNCLYQYSSHVLFPRPRFSLWIKNYSLKVPVDSLIDETMNAFDIAFYGDGNDLILRRNTLEVGTYNDIAIERLTLGIQVNPFSLARELELKACLIPSGVISVYDPISNQK